MSCEVLGGYFNGDKPRTIRFIAWFLFVLGILSALLGIILLLSLPVGLISESFKDEVEGVGLLAIAVAMGTAGGALIRLAKDL